LTVSILTQGTATPLYYTMMETGEKRLEDAQEPIGAHYDVRLPKLPWHRRIQIPIIAAVVYSVIRVLGPTVRFEVLGRANADRTWTAKQPIIWAFWHRCIIPIAWYGRNRGIVIMNTTAFDGQWTRKVIEWLGFGTAQGSSSRGGLRGLQVMAQRIKEGLDCGFTIDGPRGPRYVAKVGPVLLARMTGAPIMVFHVGVQRGRTFEKTWDHFCMPSLFTRAILVGSPPIHVPQDADAETLKAKHEEMQKALERVRDLTEGWFSLSEEERNRYRAEIGP
jgi:lysophospholipid acyltransferase (LPLAT)-like uncharacterized protein